MQLFKESLSTTPGFFPIYQKMTDKIALILSGSGVYDGTEVHEASAACVAISRAGKEVVFYAPEISQHHVIDHASGQEEEGSARNVRFVLAFLYMRVFC